MTIQKKIKIVEIVLAISGGVILLTFFLLGTFFDEQISRWFLPKNEHNFFGLFFDIFGMGIYTIPALASIIVFLNWLVFTKQKKVPKSFLISFYVFVVLLFLVLDSTKIFQTRDNFYLMTWAITLVTYLIVYGVLFFFFYHPNQIKKFKKNYYHLQSLLAMVIYILLAYFTVSLLKIIFVRPRIMTVVDEGVAYRPWWKIVWNPYENNNSFPSGHTAVAMSFLSLLFLTKKNQWWYLLLASLIWLIIFSVAFSRIVYLKHFLTDVIAAMIVGVGWFYFGNWINQQKWLAKWGLE